MKLISFTTAITLLGDADSVLHDGNGDICEYPAGTFDHPDKQDRVTLEWNEGRGEDDDAQMAVLLREMNPQVSLAGSALTFTDEDGNGITFILLKLWNAERPEPKRELLLYHGRTDPNAEMDDWGSNAAPIVGVIALVFTYMSTYRVVFESKESMEAAQKATGWTVWDENMLEMKFENGDLVRVDPEGQPPVFYGDWQFGLSKEES